MSVNLAPAGAATFGDLGLPPELVAVLAARGITQPLPIQAATIADALDGRDVSGKAPTGSGKTLAFGLPVAARVGQGRPNRPAALVLAPTRELAAQITDELRPLLKARRRRVHAFYGGVGFGAQLAALRRGVDVAVACPGRLEDLVSAKRVSLGDVATVVVDEADRMADMGFLPAVRRLLDQTASERQTLLYSATLDGDVDVLVRRYQRDPVRHEVEVDTDALARVTHRFVAVAREERAARCAELIDGSTIVFVRTKHGADRLAKQLARAKVPAVAIHGDRSQGQRERALGSFRAGKAWALVATDVAARGIHVDDVARVVHYDLPADAKDYVHRSGRTARVGASGSVVALVPPDQHGAAHDLIRALDLDAELVGGFTPPGAAVRAAAAPAAAPAVSGARTRPGGGSRRRRPVRVGSRTGHPRRRIAGRPPAGPPSGPRRRAEGAARSTGPNGRPGPGALRGAARRPR